MGSLAVWMPLTKSKVTLGMMGPGRAGGNATAVPKLHFRAYVRPYLSIARGSAMLDLNV